MGGGKVAKGGKGGGKKGGKGSKGSKGGKGKGKGKGGGRATRASAGGDDAPRRLALGDDVSLSEGEASDGPEIEDDESIDDSLAFGDSDEELNKMFEGITTKQKEKKKDAAAAREAAAAAKKGGKGAKKAATPGYQQEEEDKIYASDETVDEDYDSSDDASDDAAGDTVNLSDLLDGKLDRMAAKKTTRAAPKVIETKAEGEFEASTLRTVDTPSLAELIASTLGASAEAKGVKEGSGSMKRLEKSLKKLEKSEGDARLIDTPEEQVERDARERQLAEEGVRKDLDKWNPTMHQNRKKEFSKYPLQEPDPVQKPTTSNAGITAVATNPMEAEIAGLLNDSGLRSSADAEKEVTSADFVKLQNEVYELVDKDQDASSQTVQRLKSVLAYEHDKKKRVKKIKSKTYRRMVRKEKEKARDKKLELLALVDPEAALKKKKEEMLKLRAEERLTQRHKNKSQWIKHMKAMAKFDPDAKAAMAGQNKMHQALMKKMDETIEDGAYKGDGDSDSSSSDSENPEHREIDTLLSENGSKSALWKLRDDINKEEDAPKKKGLWGMKFMKRGEEKNKEELLKMVDDLEEDVDLYRAGEEPLGDSRTRAAKSSENDSDADVEQETRKRVTRTGRIRFAGADADDSPAAAAAAAAAAPSSSVKKVRFGNKGAAAITDDFHGEEPSLAADAGVSPTTSPSQRPAAAAATSTPAKKKGTKRARDAAASTAADVAVPIEDTEAGVAGILAAGKKRRVVVRKVVRKRKRGTDDEDAAANTPPPSPEEAPTPAKKARVLKSSLKGKKKKAGDEVETTDGLVMNQDYLVHRAFAADTLAAEFQKEKEGAAEAAVEGIDTNEALPGWGEWGGEDETLNEKAKARKAVLEAERKAKVDAARSKRKDAKLKNVMINENEDTLDPKFTLNKVPFPFRSAEQYEATMETPVGPDWNTEAKTRSFNRPKFVTKKGEIITPIEAEQGARKPEQTKRRKMAKKKKAEA